jgi:hypothetical protein
MLREGNCAYRFLRGDRTIAFCGCARSQERETVVAAALGWILIEKAHPSLFHQNPPFLSSHTSAHTNPALLLSIDQELILI